MALAQRVMGSNMVLIPVLAMIGAALFYGDAMITPAISVLSAVEGLKIITPAFEPYILPLTLAIIIALFAVQPAAPPVWPRSSAPSHSSGSCLALAGISQIAIIRRAASFNPPMP